MAASEATKVAAQAKASGAAKPKAKKKSKLARDLELLTHKPKNKGEEFRRRDLVHRLLRWCIQIACFFAFPSIFSASFNGVKYVFQQLGVTEPIELSSFVVLLLCVLAFTCVFGRFFCGYCCAFGTLGDVVFAVFSPVRRLLKLDKKTLPHGLRRALHLLKYVVLVGICALCFVGAWSTYSGYSPWVSFAAIDALAIDGVSTGAFVTLGVVVVGMAFVERFFCQFLCPLGAVFSLLPVLPISLYSRDRAKCAKKCDRCRTNCPVGIHPERGSLEAGECIACGRCVDGCPVRNVALVGHGAEARLRGNELVLTLLKAAAFLAMCWLVA